MNSTPKQADTSASDEERFEDASSKEFNEQAVNDIIEQTTGLHVGNTLDPSKSTSPEQSEKFLDCKSNADSDGENNDNKSECLDDDDFIDEESLRDLESDLTEEEKFTNKAKADELKVQGNDLFKQGEFDKSVKLYTEALRICPLNNSAERSILYANRAAAKTKLNFKPSAIDDCTKAIEHNPVYLKALLRRATLYEEADKLDESLEDFKKVLELDPANGEAKAAQTRLPPKIQERNERLKEEMMGKLKDLGNMILRPFGLSTQNFAMQQDPTTGSYSINFKSGN